MNKSKNSLTKILLVEDEPDLGDSLKQFIEFDDFEVLLCRNGKSALEAIAKTPFDLYILDVMLPDISGFDIVKQLDSKQLQTPFIFLTAKQQKLDKLTGLRLGADDYITKPFEADELILRIKNILKRTKGTIAKNQFIGEYCFDYKNLKLCIWDRVSILTEKEADLLKYLTENPNQLIKRNQLLKALWGEDDYFMGRSMDVFISRLRKLLKNDISISIDTVRGVGFVFRMKS